MKARVGEYSKKYILNLNKSIDSNGCWRSTHVANTAGQIQVSIEGHFYVLSRVVMCLWYNIDYYNYKVLARHLCNNGVCFNPDHIVPGTDSENQFDAVKAGTHFNASKECCPKCNGPYTKIRTRRNGKYVIERYCKYCSMMRRRKK